VRDPRARRAEQSAHEDLSRERAAVESNVAAHDTGAPAWHRAARSKRAAKQPRKAPRQERSIETVSILIEATRRILLRDGLAGMTTRQVADEAGVGVGTVYQYFPTREALLAAHEERALTAILDELAAALMAAMARVVADGPLGERGAYALARAGIDALVKNAQAYRFAAGQVDLTARSEHKLDLANRAADVLASALESRRENVFPRRMRRAAMLVVTTAVVLSFLWPTEHPEDVASGEFQHELATMLTRYLVARVSAGPSER
jgi:AcrR family transcriptional regulator